MQETTFLIWFIVLAVLGSIANYLWLKWTKKKLSSITRRSLIIKAFFGVVAGLISGALTNATVGADNVSIIGAILIAMPAGATAESFISKYLKRNE